MKKFSRILIFISIIIPLVVYAATITMNASGLWSSTSSWSGGVLPTSTDDVVLNNGISTTIQNGDNYTIKTLTTSNNNTLTIDEGGSLTISNSGATAITAQNNETFNVNGDLTIVGDLVINNNITFNVGTNGSVTITGNVVINNGAALDVQGTMSISGDFTGGNNTAVNVDGSLAVGGAIDTGNGSTLAGTGTVSATGGCTGDPDFCAGAPLPVELIYFEGTAAKSQIELQWGSASEEDFDFYTIEKSLDGYDFIELARIEGTGGFNQSYDYSYRDEVPSPGINYYRLKSTDLDGSFKYHKIIGVNFDGEIEDDFRMYPNPTFDTYVTIRPSISSDSGIIEVFDSFGTMIYQKQINSIAETIQLPSDIKPGLYTVRLITGDKGSTRRLVVSR